MSKVLATLISIPSILISLYVDSLVSPIIEDAFVDVISAFNPGYAFTLRLMFFLSSFVSTSAVIFGILKGLGIDL